MQTFKKSARTSKLEGKAIWEGVQRTVGSYRTTPHPATKESPDMLMFGRELLSKLPEGSYPQEKFHTTQSDKETQKEADERVRGQEANARESLIVVGNPTPFEAEQSRFSHPSI